MARIIKRGEIWLINLEPGFGQEMHKKRPALIISKNSINFQTNHVIIIPASSQIPAILGIEMVLIDKIKGLDKKSVLLPLFIKSVDQERLIKKIGTISKIKLQEVEDTIKIVLDLKKENYLN